MNKVKILVADDITQNVKLLRVILTASDYEVVEAYDGEEALEKVHTEKPDLILLDVMMPKFSGYDVCKTLRSDNATKNIPVVMITALHEMNDKLKGIESGADDFISKPFNKTELLARVKSLLRSRQMVQKEADTKILDTIIADLSEGVIVANGQWQITNMNQPARELLNISETEQQNQDLQASLSGMNLSTPLDTILNTNEKTITFQASSNNKQYPLKSTIKLSKIFGKDGDMVHAILILKKDEKT